MQCNLLGISFQCKLHPGASCTICGMVLQVVSCGGLQALFSAMRWHLACFAGNVQFPTHSLLTVHSLLLPVTHCYSPLTHCCQSFAHIGPLGRSRADSGVWYRDVGPCRSEGHSPLFHATRWLLACFARNIQIPIHYLLTVHSLLLTITHCYSLLTQGHYWFAVFSSLCRSRSDFISGWPRSDAKLQKPNSSLTGLCRIAGSKTNRRTIVARGSRVCSG